MTRLLCTGDWHVGAGQDYGREPGDRLADQRAVAERIVDLAIERDVDAVLLAGDLWHRRRPTPAELLAVREPLRRLPGELAVLAIPGNHDVEALDAPIALDLFRDFVDVASSPRVLPLPRSNRSAQAGRAVSVACLPWAPVSRLVAARNGGDRDLLNREAAGLLVSTARGLRGKIGDDRAAVLMLHWSISGASTPTGVATDDFREVVLDVDALQALGFDTVVAGHIHKPQAFPGGFYVGSPAPVDFGESGSGHGCFVLDTETGDAEFFEIPSRPFVTVDVDCMRAAEQHPNFAHNMIVDALETTDLTRAVVRIRYRATESQARNVDQPTLRRVAVEEGAHKVYTIQPDIVREARARVDGVDEDLAPLAAVDAWVAANEIPTDDSAALVELTAGYLEGAAA